MTDRLKKIAERVAALENEAQMNLGKSDSIEEQIYEISKTLTFEEMMEIDGYIAEKLL